MRRIPATVVLLCIFTVSGFSGLIYESIWSHYLKLFLGHAAYSQVLVLAIFMGGMAIGSAIAGHFSVRWRQVLLAYAAVEAATGLMALCFHGAFDAITRASFNSIIPSLDSTAAVHAYKWSLGAAMILPQSILLGMTFPLMSAGFLRLAPENAGRGVAMLYFTNSLGGSIGVLASGFLLIPAMGLPGAIMTAGLLNMIVALATWLLVRTAPERPAQVRAEAGQAPQNGPSAGYRLLLAASLVTGMASFCYEVGWLRMLGLVLGSSTHAFELMLSAFILGLALGGIWIRRHIERVSDHYALLAVVQLAMGLLALSTLFVYGEAFEWMGIVVRAFSPTETGYAGFNWASHLIASAIMVPTTFCAGMTLPIITYAALRGGTGERAIGGVYAANTLGAIAGIALSVHVLMPLFNARGVIIAGALLDFGLGMVLLNAASPALRKPAAALAAGVGVMAFAVALFSPGVDSRKMVSGVFRHGVSLPPSQEVVYLRDGKTATISLARVGSVVGLATNGKTDASINMGAGPLSGDEETQILLGVLPVLLHPSARTAAIIGFGSGMSTHAMLGATALDRVDTIEIEKRIVDAAHRGFFPRNRRAYEDARGVVHIEDAKTFFSVSRSKYDIIVSEPSNPWVSGVASLFTVEFYRHVADHLNEDGLLVQWLQLYEIDFDSVASIMKALSPSFSDYAVYVTDKKNILIAARRNGPIGDIENRAFSPQAVKDDLARVGFANASEVRARRIGNKAVLDPFFRQSGAPLNSDYFPYIDHQAAKSRFMKSRATEVTELAEVALPIPEMLGDPGKGNYDLLAPADPGSDSRKLALLVIEAVIAQRDSMELGRMRQDVLIARLGASDCGARAPAAWTQAWINVGRFVARHLERDSAFRFWSKLVPAACQARLSQRDRTWRELLVSVAAREPDAILRQARLLTAPADPMPASDIAYLVAATMLGHLARGEYEQALAESQRLHQSFPPDYKMPAEIIWMDAIARDALRKG